MEQHHGLLVRQLLLVSERMERPTQATDIQLVLVAVHIGQHSLQLLSLMIAAKSAARMLGRSSQACLPGVNISCRSLSQESGYVCPLALLLLLQSWILEDRELSG